MNEIFAHLYEWFGLIPLYSKDLGEHLKGFDITCTDYVGTPYYSYIGLVMIFSVLILYGLQYRGINSSKFNKRFHWWIMAIVIFILNFLVAFILSFTDLQREEFCNQFHITVYDCIGFGFSNAIWSLILSMVVTSLPYPRGWAGHNMTETTFWKPKS